MFLCYLSLNLSDGGCLGFLMTRGVCLPFQEPTFTSNMTSMEVVTTVVLPSLFLPRFHTRFTFLLTLHCEAKLQSSFISVDVLSRALRPRGHRAGGTVAEGTCPAICLWLKLQVGSPVCSWVFHCNLHLLYAYDFMKRD